MKNQKKKKKLKIKNIIIRNEIKKNKYIICCLYFYKGEKEHACANFELKESVLALQKKKK